MSGGSSSCGSRATQRPVGHSGRDRVASTRSTSGARAGLDFASDRTTELFRQISSSSHSELAVSPDEEWILYSEAPEWQFELMLVENFRHGLWRGVRPLRP